MAQRLLSTYHTLCYKEIQENTNTSFWDFVLNSGLRKFRYGISVVKTCINLVDAQSVINWTVDREQVIVRLRLQHDSAAQVH